VSRKSRKQPIKRTGKVLLFACALAFVLPLVFAVLVATSRSRFKSNPASVAMTNSDATVFAAYGKSPSCKSCHEEAYKNWEKSHHALAERPMDGAIDSPAFEPARQIKHGTQQSEVRLANDKFQLITQGLSKTNQTFEVSRVIGVDPLLQYLIPAEGGRLQATELCFDPKRMEWFNVYGNEDRQPGEWGHWTGRGMNWNNMCATCHNTRLRKNYDERTDSYRTTMAEQGVGCEACHGPMADHNAWQAKHPNQSGDPTIRKLSKQQMFHTCAQCHARRAELTGDFRPGENFFDHHALTIPDETDLFYPDGQVREEDYEFTAFLGSKMHAAGVRCVDCHEPHTSKLRLPGNQMCMACHGNVLTNGAPRIELETHSRHKVGTSGDFCTDCHMPTTFYMQRHPRHDHGFTVPDPRLTKEFGIPNACNRCHTNQTADWSLEAINKWYGPRTN
jgi:predicted CXXCH cytochrome family protein